MIAVAAAFGVHQMIFHSQQIIVLRDPGSYLQFAAWIAHHGSLPIPQTRAAFGGTHHVLTFNSPAFYQVGNAIVPQFMAGLPMVLAAGFWAGGCGRGGRGGAAAGGLRGAHLRRPGRPARRAAVGAAGGPRARALPARSSSPAGQRYSEPLAQILFLGGLCLVIDSLQNGAGARVMAALGGLALGLTLVVRIDGASDILPVIPYCGILLLSRRRQAMPLLGGLAAGALCGAVDGLVLSRPYLAHIKSSLVPLALAFGVAVIATAVVVAVRWRRGLPRVRGNWLPSTAALVPVLVMILFAVRAYLHPVTNNPLHVTQNAVGSQQPVQLPANWYLPYYAISLRWVFWYIGIPAVVLATFAAAVLARRCLQGRAPAWTLPLMAFGWTIVAGLYRPAIYPDHPWASRRLVPAVLPGLIVLAVWGSGWLVGWARKNGGRRVASGAVASVCAAMLLVPPAIATFGLKIRYGGPSVIRLAADGLAFKTTFSGEIAAVNRMCAAIPRGSAVVIIGLRAGHQLPEVVRGMCGVPAAGIAYPQVSSLKQVVRGIEQAGARCSWRGRPPSSRPTAGR